MLILQDARTSSRKISNAFVCRLRRYLAWCITVLMLGGLGCADPAAVPSSGDTSPAPVNNPPAATFSTSCTSLDCNFDAAASTDADGSITTYDWDFGDGATVSGVSPDHGYASDGNYTVTLVVADNAGATGTGSQTVAVSSTGNSNNPPSASFSSNCTDLSCNFDAAASTDSDGVIVSYSWDYGASATGSGMTSGHDYAGDGTYSVTLTVTDNGGLTSTSTQDVSVIAQVSAPDGQVLYQQKCSTCHGADALGGTLTEHSIVDHTAAEITDAINTIPSHSYLRSLTAEEIQAIADYLLTLFTGTTDTGGSSWAKVTLADSAGTIVTTESDPATGIYSASSAKLSGPVLARAYFPNEDRVLFGYASQPGVLNITLLTDQVVKTALAEIQVETCFANSAASVSCLAKLSPADAAFLELWLATDLADLFSESNLDSRARWMNVPFDENRSGMGELLHTIWTQSVLSCSHSTNDSGFINRIESDAGCFGY